MLFYFSLDFRVIYIFQYNNPPALVFYPHFMDNAQRMWITSRRSDGWLVMNLNLNPGPCDVRVRALSITPYWLLLVEFSDVDISPDLISETTACRLYSSWCDHKVLVHLYQDWKTESREPIWENDTQWEEGTDLNQWLSNMSVHHIHLEGWLSYKLLGSTQKESLGLGWDLRICISDKFRGSPDAAGPASTLWEALADLNSEREGAKNGKDAGSRG